MSARLIWKILTIADTRALGPSAYEKPQGHKPSRMQQRPGGRASLEKYRSRQSEILGEKRTGSDQKSSGSGRRTQTKGKTAMEEMT